LRLFRGWGLYYFKSVAESRDTLDKIKEDTDSMLDLLFNGLLKR
jgi:hypothetical protein